MRRALLLTAGMLWVSGCADPETEPLRPGTRAVTVTWRPSISKIVHNAVFLDEGAAIGSLPPGVKVTVLSEVGDRARHPNATPQVRVRVEDGPLEGHTGRVYRPHLRAARHAAAAKP